MAVLISLQNLHFQSYTEIDAISGMDDGDDRIHEGTGCCTMGINEIRDAVYQNTSRTLNAITR